MINNERNELNEKRFKPQSAQSFFKLYWFLICESVAK